VADFDPHAFVADFDPEDFVGEGGPESFLDPKKFKPSHGRRPFANTGPIEKVRADLHPDLPEVTATGAANAAGNALMSMADRSSFGLLGQALGLDRDVLSKNPIARAIDESPIGPYVGKRGGDVADRALRGMEGYRQDAPTVSRYTDIPGYMSGPADTVAEGLGNGLGMLGRAVRGGLARTAGGRARIALDEAGASVSAPKGEFGQTVKPTGTFNPAATVEGGTFEGMEAGRAIEALERAKAVAPSSQSAAIDEEIARIRTAASEMTPADKRIAAAREALQFHRPGVHEVTAGSALGAVLHYSGLGHGVMGGPLAALVTAGARNARPIAGRLIAAPQVEFAGGPMSLLLQAAAGAQGNANQ